MHRVGRASRTDFLGLAIGYRHSEVERDLA